MTKQGPPGKQTNTFIEDEVLNSDGDSATSPVYDCRLRRKFLLYVQIVETGDPADSTVQIKVQFSDTPAGPFHDYQNGPFGYMLWEEDAIPAGAVGLVVCTEGGCVGKFMRVYIESAIGTTLDVDNYFTVTIKADFMD